MASSVQQKFQVFLSFRGEDTRVSFTSHLDAALKRKGINAYVDYQLDKGEKIEALLTAIEESSISIIVLSKNYASSSWCLKELSKILECKERHWQKVVPIFYHVDSSDVKHIRGSFKEGLEKLQERFKDEVEGWKAALVEVADLPGFHLPGQPNDRLEYEVVEEIAEDISEKLICNFSVDTKQLVGIDSRIKEIESLLCFDLKDVCIRIVGIWGMGGIGKTTIAENVYNKWFRKFEGYCFVNVRKELNLRQKLFSELLEDKNLIVGTNSLDASIIDRLQCKKVFFVLDDGKFSDLPCLLFLKFRSIKFGYGSKVIVTSQDKQLLDALVVDEMHEVRGLNDDEAFQLFTSCALKPNQPKEDFVVLSNEVVRYVQGVPLALIYFGSSLYGKPLELWRGDLEKLKTIHNREIDDILIISYDGLDEESQNIFLDIACFFNWESMDYVKDLLDRCYISALTGIENLIRKSLLTISNGRIKMHNLHRQMALNIIKQESMEPGKRSRLWNPVDIYCVLTNVLTNNTVNESVEGMLLDMSKLSGKECISRTAFARMCRLRILKFYFSDSERERKVFLEKGLESLPSTPSLIVMLNT